MRRTAFIGFIGVLLFSGCHRKAGNGTDRQAVPVRTAAVLFRIMSEPVRASGILVSESQIKLSFKTGGIIEKLSVREGERVRQGQALASLKLDEIRALTGQAKNGHEKAVRDFERARNLYRDSVATLEQIQDAQTALNVAKANLDIAEFNLGHSQIAAPSNGRILRRLAEANELIGPGYPVFLFGTDGSPWIVKVGVIDRDVVRLTIGDSASVSLDAFPNRRFSALVRTIAGAPDPMNGLFEIELNVWMGTQAFTNGLMADAEIFPSQKRPYRVIPFDALADVRGVQGTVYTVNEKLIARKTPITIGFIVGDRVAVEKGLEATDRVVTDGSSYLDDGIPVKVVQGTEK